MKYHRTATPIGSVSPLVIALFSHMDSKEITLAQAAMLSGVNEANISNWRRGARSPRLDLFLAVANAVGLSVSFNRTLKRRTAADQTELGI